MRKVPARKCIGCLEIKSKKELVRVVKTINAEFFLDLTGKVPGRGAYICRCLECLEKAKKKKALERSFKQAIPSAVYESIRKALEDGS